MNTSHRLLSLATMFIVGLTAGCHDHPLCDETNATPCNEITLIGGVEDNFAQGNEEPAAPSNEMIAYMNHRYRVIPNNPLNQLTMQFDEPKPDRAFGHTFRLPAENIQSVQRAILTVHLRSLGGSNDGMHIVDVTGKENVVDPIWASYIHSFNNGSWNWGEEVTIRLDLSALPPFKDNPTDIRDALKDGTISLYVQDDTQVDYAKLEVSYCTEESGDDDGLF